MDRGLGGRHDDRALPNLLVPIDLRDGQPTGPSLFALSEGRRVAHAAGATVFAIVFTEDPLPEAVTARLGRAGADKVLMCEGPGLGAPPLDATHGAALYAAAERIPPLLVLFPAGGAGRELGPALAARLGGAFASTADLELGGAVVALADGVGRVVLRRWHRDRASYRRLDPVELERPVIAVLPAGSPGAAIGSGDVEVEVIECVPPARVGVVELASQPDEHAAVALASVLVVVDPALAPAARAGLPRSVAGGVPVVDTSPPAIALIDAAPRVLVAIDAPEVGAGVTPRSRVGTITTHDAGPSPLPGADAAWKTAGASATFWAELDGALSSLAAAGREPGA